METIRTLNTKCFAAQGGICVALEGTDTCEQCAFFKTRMEQRLARKASRTRIQSLPAEKRLNIQSLYYSTLPEMDDTSELLDRKEPAYELERRSC